MGGTKPNSPLSLAVKGDKINWFWPNSSSPPCAHFLTKFIMCLPGGHGKS